MKFPIFLASYLIRVAEATRTKERPNSLPYRKFEVDPPPLKEPLVEVEFRLDYQRLIKKEGSLPIKRRVELACRISCPDCGVPSEYIYSNGHGPAPKEDREDFVSQF